MKTLLQALGVRSLLIFLLLIVFRGVSYATENIDTLMVEIEPGELSSVLREYDFLGIRINHLIVKGGMNGFDFSELREFGIESVDISDVRVVKNDEDDLTNNFVDADNALNQGVFDDFRMSRIVLPESLSLIKKNTFDENMNIKEIWLQLSDSLKIESYAFRENYYTINLIVKEQIPFSNADLNVNMWSWPSSWATLYVPKGCKSAYMNAVENDRYGNKVLLNYVWGCKEIKEYNRYEKTTESPIVNIDETNKVTISCKNPNAKIYYNIDKEEIYLTQDNSNCIEYTEPFYVSKNCIIKAFAVCENEDYSDVAVYNVESFKTPSPSISTSDLVSINYADVTLSCPDSNAVIYYTTDGTEPTENSTKYEFPFRVEKCTTVKAVAINKDGFNMSDVESAEVVIKVETPYVVYVDEQFIGVGYIGSDVTIRYTTDGTDPNENSAVFKSSYPGFNATYKFRAFKDGCVSSDVATLVVDNVQLLQPEISVADGVVTIKNNSLEQEFTQSDDLADIYYTLDGSEPDENSTLYTGPFIINENCEIRAIAVMEKRLNSNIAFYNVSSFICESPIIKFEDGKVTITTNTVGAKIYYTLNGSNPNRSSFLYAEPFTIDGNCEIKAIAVMDKWTDSGVTLYTVQSFVCEAPIIKYEEDKIIITTNTLGAEIYYTLDGTTPSKTRLLYREPFFVNENCVIRAIAVKEKYETSEISVYDVKLLTCEQPVIKWDGNKITITTDTDGAEIYYTLNGSQPTKDAILYKEPFYFKGGIVKAIAVKNGRLNSSVNTISEISWPEFEVIVGDRVKLEMEITGGLRVGFRTVSASGYVLQEIETVGNDWYVNFTALGPTILEAYVLGGAGESLGRKAFNVLSDRDILLIDGIYYRYTDETKTALKVVYGFEQYENEVVIPSVAEGLPVVSIGDQAFYSNNDLTSVTLPEGLTRIESDQAFGNCPNLSKIVLPSTLTYIGSYAFNVDSGLKEIYCNMRDPSKVEIFGGESIFNGFVDYDNCILYVPYGCVQAYREAEVWKNFKNIVEGEKVPIPVVSIQFENESMVMTEGDVAALQVTVLPEDADNKALAWLSSDNGVVSVNSEGLVTAVSVGQAIITAAAVDGSCVEGSCVIEVKSILKGDSNNDNAVTVTDAVNTANYAMEKDVAAFNVRAADVNGDETITMADASGTISIVLEQPVLNSATLAMAMSNVTRGLGDVLVVDDYLLKPGETATLSVGLDNLTDYVALQADVVMPDGLTLDGVEAGVRAEATHSLFMRQVADDVYRVVLFSASGQAFANNKEPLFMLKVKSERCSDGDITFERILAADAEATEYRLSYTGGHNTLSSGINGVDGGVITVRPCPGGLEVLNAEGLRVYVYGFDGSLLTSFVADADGARLPLQPGVYIVKVGTLIYKVAIK